MAGALALLPTGAGPLLTGSADTAIRLWDGARPEASYMVCGPPALPSPSSVAGPAPGGGGPNPNPSAGGGPNPGAEAGALPVAYVYAGRQMAGVPVVEETCISHNSEPQARAPPRFVRFCRLSPSSF